MRKLAVTLVVLAGLAVPASAPAQVIVSPVHHHHAKAHRHGYLYFSEARLRTVQRVTAFSIHHAGVYTLGACHRRTDLRVNCDVQRAFVEERVNTVCDYYVGVREFTRRGQTFWASQLFLRSRSCRLA